MAIDESKPRRLRVFLCHAKEDAFSVREMYERLCSQGFDPWMDEYNLLPGMRWRPEIVDRIKKSDAAILFLSAVSVTKKSFIEEEMELIISKAEEIKVGGTIFLIPAFLDDLRLPKHLAQRLAKWQLVKLGDTDGPEKLVAALRARENDFGIERQQKTGMDSSSTPPRNPISETSDINRPAGILPGNSTDENIGGIIVFVPGFFGTELSYREPAKGSWPERVWSADGSTLVMTLAQHPKRLEHDTVLEVGDVLPAIYFGREYFPLYQQLFDMIKSLNYEEGKDFYPFGYDWRLSIKTNAQRLAGFLEKVGDGRPIEIIAHSMGGLIVRYMLANQRTQDSHSDVRSVIQIATPVLGCSRAYFALKESAQFGDLCEWMENQMAELDESSFDHLKNAMNQFESVMELLPHADEKILKTKGGKFYPALHPEAWPDVDKARLKHIQDVQSIVREAGLPSMATIYSVDIQTDHIYEVDNEFRKITKKLPSDGDGVAIGISAEHGSATTYPLKVRATHYALPSHKKVLKIVKDSISHKKGLAV